MSSDPDIKLTRQAILDAALRITDHDGVDKLTMRRLASELGVQAMSLYHHIPNKSALLDGVVEQLVTHIERPVMDPNAWQDSLREVAFSLHDALMAHRNVVPLIATRPAMTAQNLAAVESVLSMLVTAGFNPAMAMRTWQSLAAFVIGHVSADISADTHDPELSPASIDASDYPVTAIAVTESADGPDTIFRWGLGAIITGFDALAESARSGQSVK